ncbi:hypothetical protein ANN_01820 [Periplaneta americana]|uniref:Uncharacterized protein n=1 Tax=Periplaneta americana TaxID=6978 RepID=A0ABQ8TW80_PERAM|nr:hypothetical protein ANN_01820 [Periplaneta americana]
MASLCEESNELLSSLKAIFNYDFVREELSQQEYKRGYWRSTLLLGHHLRTIRPKSTLVTATYRENDARQRRRPTIPPLPPAGEFMVPAPGTVPPLQPAEVAAEDRKNMAARASVGGNVQRTHKAASKTWQHTQREKRITISCNQIMLYQLLR